MDAGILGRRRNQSIEVVLGRKLCRCALKLKEKKGGGGFLTGTI